MIRVLELCSTSDLGGAERMVLNLASALPPQEYDVHVGALIGSGALVNEAGKRGLAAAHFQFKHAASLTGVKRVVAYCREHRIDVVQSHGLRADVVARLASGPAGFKVISTIHSIDPWRKTPHVMLDRATARYVTRYVAVCEAARQAAIRREKTPGGLIQVVPIGVPRQDIPRERRDEVRQHLGIQDDAYPVIGVLANLRDMKGHLHIIKALPALLQQLPHIHFLFAGRDDSEGSVKAAAEAAGVAHAITFLGFVEDTPSLFAAMDMFLLASDWEGFPVSILESMQAGVPVIATRVGGIPEMIRDGEDGLLIPPRNPEAIVQAILALTRDFALRAALVRSADARYQSLYTVEGMAETMAHIFQAVVKKT